MHCLRNKITIFLAAVFLAGCSDTDAWSPERGRFVQAYSGAMYEREKGGDSADTKRRIDSVLNTWGFTESEFKEKFNAYARNPQFMRKMFDSAQAIATQRATEKRR